MGFLQCCAHNQWRPFPLLRPGRAYWRLKSNTTLSFTPSLWQGGAIPPPAAPTPIC
uniref:Uncharacterized protein n=1 Tax=Anguilla anguilla TaxID=7936 RepID=A0A0E9Q221_ANGAN